MNRTKIEWADVTWNPVTGCLHGCEYCYARRIARRFCHDPWNTVEDGINHYVGLPMQNEHYKSGRIDPYPYGFDPTFHRYRLDEPAYKRKPRNIFVCSMADLFGEWVPDEWITDVFDACAAAPQHRYLFLTKNPSRYLDLYLENKLPKQSNFWYGTTITNQADYESREEALFDLSQACNTFFSIEPMHGEINMGLMPPWIIIGAETGNRKGKIIPKREWVENIVFSCVDEVIFMKESLRPIWGKDLIQEYAWGQQR